MIVYHLLDKKSKICSDINNDVYRSAFNRRCTNDTSKRSSSRRRKRIWNTSKKISNGFKIEIEVVGWEPLAGYKEIDDLWKFLENPQNNCVIVDRGSRRIYPNIYPPMMARLWEWYIPAKHLILLSKTWNSFLVLRLQ